MLTEEQKENLKPGDRLIFIENHGLSGKKGRVFTFANWYNANVMVWEKNLYFQCKELHDCGNHEHNFAIYYTEVFNPAIHKEFEFATIENLERDKAEFIKLYGA